MCGGTDGAYLIAYRVRGLSPRVRGNPDETATASGGEGSIPACAGEPFLRCGVMVGLRVYPRVCGGTNCSDDPLCTESGLSPRVRGNHSRRDFGRGSDRSIPACAGEPVENLGPLEEIEVYPRVCGGTFSVTQYRGRSAGLSPRVRGNRGCARHEEPYVRSIPACAGEPSRRTAGRRTSGVYPRVCGGTRITRRLCASKTGLSPRVRGNHRAYADRGYGARSIPACAGEPAGDRRRHHQVAVYPRVCGGT